MDIGNWKMNYTSSAQIQRNIVLFLQNIQMTFALTVVQVYFLKVHLSTSKAEFKRVMFALPAGKQKSGKKCTNSTFLWQHCGLLVFGLSTLAATKGTKFLWSTSVAHC